MEECTKCHRSEREVRLFDVIFENEVVKMCERCAIIEDIPIIKRPTISQLKEAEKNYSVYQRLKRIAGLEKKEEKHENILNRLRELDEHPELEMPEEESINLVHNFHWYIMRARRNKGLSQRQLAMLLGESEEAVKMIERGELPGEPEILIKKLEQFFQIKLRERTEKEIEEEKEKLRESSFLRRRALERENQEKNSSERKEKEENAEFEGAEAEIIQRQETEEDIVSSVAYGKTVNIELEEGSMEKSPARVLSFNSNAFKNLTIDDLQKMKEERERVEELIEVGEGELKAEKFIQGVKRDEKRKQELREKIADEMKYEALGKNVERRKQGSLGKKELLKRRDYVPSISELAARKKEKGQEKLTGDEIELEE